MKNDNLRIIGTAIECGYRPTFWNEFTNTNISTDDLLIAEIYFIERWLREKRSYEIEICKCGHVEIKYHAEDIMYHGERKYGSEIMFDTFDGAKFHGIKLILNKIKSEKW